MPIDKFSKQEFEAALPLHKDTGQPLWEAEGMVKGEEQYAIHFTRKDEEAIRLVIRSSVNGDGYAADTGEDSIRIWLEGGERMLDDGYRYQALGKGSGMWVIRVTGWQHRLEKRLRELWKIALKVSRCPQHGTWKSVKVSGKKTKNPGRMFESCRECYREGKKDTHFRWLEN